MLKRPANPRKTSQAVQQRRLTRRHIIMQAAERLFTGRRFHEVTMDAVAAEACVAKGTLYGYFPDKEELFFQTVASGMDELCDMLERRAPAGMPFPARLSYTCRQISGFYQQRRPLLRMMQIEDARLARCPGSLGERWIAKRKGLLAAVAMIMADGIAAGHIRRDASPLVLASMLMGMLRARAHDLVHLEPAMRSDEIIADLFLRGAQGGAQVRPDTRRSRPATSSEIARRQA